KSIDVIFKPRSACSSFTVAVVVTRLAGCPAFSRLNDRAIEKQPASAAPMSSSGFVPFPSSKRDENEYGPSNAPLPSFIVPFPCLRVPSHTADPVRVAIGFLLLLNCSFTSRAGRGRTQCVFDLPQDCHVERSETSLAAAPSEIAHEMIRDSSLRSE